VSDESDISLDRPNIRPGSRDRALLRDQDSVTLSRRIHACRARPVWAGTARRRAVDARCTAIAAVLVEGSAPAHARRIATATRARLRAARRRISGVERSAHGDHESPRDRKGGADVTGGTFCRRCAKLDRADWRRARTGRRETGARRLGTGYAAHQAGRGVRIVWKSAVDSAPTRPSKGGRRARAARSSGAAREAGASRRA
jgi:hypothetical protein